MEFTRLYLERSIDSSHVIPNHPGKCGRLHGHTYRFQVWMSGPVNSDTGMLVDFYDVKKLIDAWDHRHLNDEVDCIPTAENLAGLMRARILREMIEQQPSVDEAYFGVQVRLWETASGYAESGGLTQDPDAIDRPIEVVGAV